jgi:hypothetical protein
MMSPAANLPLWSARLPGVTDRMITRPDLSMAILNPSFLEAAAGRTADKELERLDASSRRSDMARAEVREVGMASKLRNRARLR